MADWRDEIKKKLTTTEDIEADRRRRQAEADAAAQRAVAQALQQIRHIFNDAQNVMTGKGKLAQVNYTSGNDSGIELNGKRIAATRCAGGKEIVIQADGKEHRLMYNVAKDALVLVESQQQYLDLDQFIGGLVLKLL